MPSTSPDSLPYPGDGDPPDGPGQLAALAEATQDALDTKSATSHGHSTYAQGQKDYESAGTTVTSSATDTASSWTATITASLSSGRVYLLLYSGTVSNPNGSVDSPVGAEVEVYGDALLASVGVQVPGRFTADAQSFGGHVVVTGSGSKDFRMRVIRRSSTSGTQATLSDGRLALVDIGAA